MSHSKTVRRGMTRQVAAVIAAISLIALSVASYLALTSYFMRNETQLTPQRAQFFAKSMDDALTRIEHLPYVLSIDPITLQALTTNDATFLNPILEEIATRARAEFVYVLDINGRTIASSNYQDADTLVGKAYTFRPYFRDAVAGGEGRFYAVGVTTGRPGYFIAEPVRDQDGNIHGVIAAKVSLNDLSSVLTTSGELVFVTDNQGVVLASSEPSLIYGHLSPLSAFDRQTLKEQQQFGDKTLFPLEWAPASGSRATLDDTGYIWTTAQLTQEDWTLHLLSDVGDIRRQALLYVAIGSAAVLSFFVAAAVFRAGQLRRALTASNADRRRLAAEIEDRRTAEQKLEIARNELARQNQLAALGQMSASITHELGQPISAMRNYLVAEEIAADAQPNSLWPALTGLVNRMERILDQLRLFGRKDGSVPMSFDGQLAVRAALQLVQHTADAAGVALRASLVENPCSILGQPDRFEQVIVNLLRNGIDASRDIANGAVSIELAMTPDAIKVYISDNGTGLGNLEIGDLREPFFSTKPSGDGMGLGLAISGQIVNEMGGTLSAANNVGAGATFVVTLPLNGQTNAE